MPYHVWKTLPDLIHHTLQKEILKYGWSPELHWGALESVQWLDILDEYTHWEVVYYNGVRRRSNGTEQLRKRAKLAQVCQQWWQLSLQIKLE